MVLAYGVLRWIGNMSVLRGLSKIIWTLDPFAEELKLVDEAAAFLESFVRKNPAEVQPVYVLSPAQLGLSIEFGDPVIQQYRPLAEQALERLMERIRSQREIPGLRTPEILVEHFSSTVQAATSICQYAKESGGKLLVCTSHSRSGVSRWILGSFTETLLSVAELPVLVIGQCNRIPRDFGTILFPTEFGAVAKKTFRELVEDARIWGSRIVLAHTIPHPIEPLLQSGAFLLGGSWVPVQAYFSHETDRHLRHAEAWARWAEHQGVQVDVHVEVTGGSIADTIVQLARNYPVDLIAMEAHSGPVAAALIGSITRDVIRHADVPVWVMRTPRAIAAARPAAA